MIKSYLHSFLLLFIVQLTTLVSCGKKDPTLESLMVGNWKGAGLVKKDSIQDIDLSHVKLNFTSYNRYHYINNLLQEEAGYFKIKDSLLIYTDTTSNPEHETAVHIQKITQDTMVLRMNLEGSEAFLILQK